MNKTAAKHKAQGQQILSSDGMAGGQTHHLKDVIIRAGICGRKTPVGWYYDCVLGMQTQVTHDHGGLRPFLIRKKENIMTHCPKGAEVSYDCGCMQLSIHLVRNTEPHDGKGGPECIPLQSRLGLSSRASRRSIAGRVLGNETSVQ